MLLSTLPILLSLTLPLLQSTSAQVVPGADQVPAACMTSCYLTLRTSTLCSQQFGNATDHRDSSACFCNDLPTDVTSCSQCLSRAGLPDLGASLATVNTACASARSVCTFTCGFTPCATDDVPCLCSSTHLQNVYDCAACNTAMMNDGNVTKQTDYQALANACDAQNYTATPTVTHPLPLPTGTAQYSAVSLTFSGSVASGGQATGLITIPVNTITTAVAPTSLTTTLANTNTNPTSISASLSMSSVVSVSLSSARAASASASRAAAASSSPSTVGANSWGERKLTVSAVVLPALGGLCWAMAMLL